MSKSTCEKVTLPSLKPLRSSTSWISRDSPKIGNSNITSRTNQVADLKTEIDKAFQQTFHAKSKIVIIEGKLKNHAYQCDEDRDHDLEILQQCRQDLAMIESSHVLFARASAAMEQVGRRSRLL